MHPHSKTGNLILRLKKSFRQLSKGFLIILIRPAPCQLKRESENEIRLNFSAGHTIEHYYAVGKNTSPGVTRRITKTTSRKIATHRGLDFLGVLLFTSYENRHQGFIKDDLIIPRPYPIFRTNHTFHP